VLVQASSSHERLQVLAGATGWASPKLAGISPPQASSGWGVSVTDHTIVGRSGSEVAAAVELDSLLGTGLAHVKEEAFPGPMLRRPKFDRHPRFDCGISSQEHFLPRLQRICNVIEYTEAGIWLDRHAEIVLDLVQAIAAKISRILPGTLRSSLVLKPRTSVKKARSRATSAELRFT
jgi:hypothetical protein